MNWILRTQNRGTTSIHFGSETEIRRLASVFRKDASARVVDGPRAMTSREMLTGVERGAVLKLACLPDESLRSVRGAA